LKDCSPSLGELSRVAFGPKTLPNGGTVSHTFLEWKNLGFGARLWNFQNSPFLTPRVPSADIYCLCSIHKYYAYAIIH